MSLEFYIGERPDTPLVLTVRNEDGTPRNLDAYTEVVIEGDLPAGTSGINSAPQGKVQYELTAPFAKAGVFGVRVKMTTADGDVDYSDFVDVVVRDPALTPTALIDAAGVEGITDEPVSHGDVVKAQGLVSLACGRDLTDPLFLAGLGDRDRFWLRMAVAYQAAEVRTAASSPVAVPYAPGVGSLTNGDISVTFSGTPAPPVAQYAAMALKKLSWMQPQRTLHATPFLGNERPEPQLWELKSKLWRV